MFKKTNILIGALLAFAFLASCKIDHVLEINALEGPKRWTALRDYLTETRRFNSPPADFWEFREDGQLLLTGGGTLRVTDEKWSIDPTNGIFMMSGMSFRSFQIRKIESNGNHFYQIQLCVNPVYDWPAEPSGFLTTGKHFLLGTTDK